jgi:hypothetical protein
VERVFCCRLWPQRGAECAYVAQQKKRTLFTDAYFGLDQLARHNNKQKLRVSSPESFKARLRADFAQHGVRNIFITDLELVLAVSENAADMELSRQLFVALLQGWIALFFFSMKNKNCAVFGPFFTVWRYLNVAVCEVVMLRSYMSFSPSNLLKITSMSGGSESRRAALSV